MERKEGDGGVVVGGSGVGGGVADLKSFLGHFFSISFYRSPIAKIDPSGAVIEREKRKCRPCCPDSIFLGSMSGQSVKGGLAILSNVCNKFFLLCLALFFAAVDAADATIFPGCRDSNPRFWYH